jgi:NitT/TauT family transport system ATP-binding protein
VGKVYLDHPGGTEAVDGVSFEVRPGAFVALTGPSGCGKSTLLRLAADLTAPTRGRVLVGGGPPASARSARTLGMVFQSPVLMVWRTVLGNVELPLAVARLPAAQRRERALEVLAQVGLAEQAARYPRQLSGGQRHRAALARALVVRPRLLLLDEPFAALDELTRERLNVLLLTLWAATDMTVLFVSHDLDEAVFLADEVVVMTPRPGRVAARLPVPLGRPRRLEDRASPGFFEATNAVREALHAGAAPTASGSGGPAPA